MSKHIVLIHRYFSPDTPPYASLLRDLAEHLGRGGNQVTVLTCQPSYTRSIVRRAARSEQLSPGVTVVRWPVLSDRSSMLLKAVNLLWFCVRLITHVPRMGHVDVVMAASTPPIAVAHVAGWLARRKGAAFVYHKQDIYPEVALRPGSTPGAVARFLRSIDGRTDRSATKVVVLSRDMAATTRQRGARSDQIAVINNFDPWRLDGMRLDGPAVRSGGELQVVFAGNLGRFQNLETLFEAMVDLRDDTIRFHFFGEGALKGRLTDLVREKGLGRVVVHGYEEPGRLATFLSCSADLGVVSLAPGVIRAAYPSKTMSYLRHGVPLLALVDADSELAATVRRAGVGCQIDPANLAELVGTLRHLVKDRSQLDSARERAQRLYVDEFDRDRRLRDWDGIFAEVTT